MKVLGYILTGVLSAAAAGTATYFVTKDRVTKKLTAQFNEDLASQLNSCREYYINKNKKFVEDVAKEVIKEEIKEYDSEEEAKEDISKGSDLVITDVATSDNPTKTKLSASDLMDEMVIKDYHKMYGAPTVETVFDEDEDQNLEDIKPKGPYLIRRAEYFNDIEDSDGEFKDYDKVEMILFTGDFIRNKDGEKEYLEILYSEGRTNDKYDDEGYIIAIQPDKEPYYERVIKSAEAAAILGQEWRHHFGDNSCDKETGKGLDYDRNEVFVRNPDLETDFYIIRDDRMYKCVIGDKEPGDNFDYSNVR